MSDCCEYNNHSSQCIRIERNSWLTWEILALQEALCTVELDRIRPNGGPCGFFIMEFLEKSNNYQMLNENLAEQRYVFGSLYEKCVFRSERYFFCYEN